MIDELVLSCLTGEQRRILQLMAEAGVVGGTEEEVAVYLITRSLVDMMRCGVLKLGDES